MRGRSSLVTTGRALRPSRATPAYVCLQCRGIQISAAPSTDASSGAGNAAFGALDSTRDSAGETIHGIDSIQARNTDILQDARFEVLGSPFSMLSVTLSASQKLYTRRGTLVAVAGKPENVHCYRL